jgi:hypothetical protein
VKKQFMLRLFLWIWFVLHFQYNLHFFSCNSIWPWSSVYIWMTTLTVTLNHHIKYFCLLWFSLSKNVKTLSSFSLLDTHRTYKDQYHYQ